MAVKVLVVSNYRDTGSVRPEAELFIGLKKAGVEVEIMTYGGCEYAGKFREAGIRVIDFHPERKFDKRESDFIRRELVAGGHDILHLFNSKAIINGIRAARGLPVKVVLYRGYTGNVHWYDPSAYLKFLHPRVDKITCLAHAVEEHLQRQLFFDKSKTVTIHKGHSPDWYADVKPLNLSELGVPPGAFTVACVANARPMKGIPHLLRAASLLPPELPVHFILIGKNMDAPHHRRLIGCSPNREKIHLPGYRSDALQIVAASDVFALPSVKGEAITKAVLEAMSLGVAPVITSIPGNRDLVADGECGLVVPPGDAEALAAAVLKLYQNQEMCREFGRRAKERAGRHFNIADTILEMKKLYEELAAEGRQ